MTQSNTGEAVKTLSLDEVAEIEREPWMHSYGDDREEAPLETRRVGITVGQRDALCATVRALETQTNDILRQLEAANEEINRLEVELAAVTEERTGLQRENERLREQRAGIHRVP